MFAPLMIIAMYLGLYAREDLASGEDASACIRPVRLDGFRLLGRAYPLLVAQPEQLLRYRGSGGFPEGYILYV